eukprot:1010631-Prymnesium_polylepis.1
MLHEPRVSSPIHIICTHGSRFCTRAQNGHQRLGPPKGVAMARAAGTEHAAGATHVANVDCAQRAVSGVGQSADLLHHIRLNIRAVRM